MPWTDRIKRRLKLRDLDVLMAVIETGSMGKAAKHLGISQPGVSKAIVELEDALGVQLFDRGRRGVVPTPYGLALQPQSVGIFNDLRQASSTSTFSRPDERRNPHRHDRSDRVGLVSPVIDAALAQASGDVLSRCLGETRRRSTRAWRTRRVELAVCRMIGRLPDELAAEILFHDAFRGDDVGGESADPPRNSTLAGSGE